jgi:hypothetical protein
MFKIEAQRLLKQLALDIKSPNKHQPQGTAIVSHDNLGAHIEKTCDTAAQQWH